ncbi:MAG: UPF0149 family protein [Acidiferrobacterales bacterium]|nr:UPF0149 family protein [Acidiferrobacterales bacterium]
MNDSSIGSAAFQQKIFNELDTKLRASPWGSGASEAHGLLAGLACAGITAETVRTRAYLLQLSDATHVEMLEGMFSLTLRELGDSGFGFNLMLPDDSQSLAERLDGISDWCQGFLQGALHENASLLQNAGSEVEEAFNDILEIGHLELDPDIDAAAADGQLLELQEFLRVAVQLIFDTLQPATAELPSTTIN